MLPPCDPLRSPFLSSQILLHALGLSWVAARRRPFRTRNARVRSVRPRLSRFPALALSRSLAPPLCCSVAFLVSASAASPFPSVLSRSTALFS